MEDKAKKLYDNLTADGYKLGTFDEFGKTMSDPQKSKKFYDNLTSDGYKLGENYDEFSTTLKKKESPVVSSEPSGTPPSQTTNLPDIGKVISEYKEHPLPLSPAQIQQKYITDAEKENDVAPLQQQAYDHAKNKNYAASNAISDIILQKDPKNSYANTLKGNNLLHDGKPALAENEFTQALKKNPTDPDLYYDRAIANIQVYGKPTPQSINDAKTYETAQGGVANGDETVARRLSHTFSIQGDESQSEYWRKNADFIKADKEKRKEAAAIASFPDYFIATSPVTAPMVGIGKGIETMGEGVKEGSVPKVLSGAMETTFGVMGYVNPELLLFNMGTAQAQYTAPSIVTEALTASITTAYVKSGGNPDNLTDWGKLGLQAGDLATFGLFFGLMKKGEGKIGEKLFRNEPLTSEETGKAVVTASEMTKADVDNTLQQGNGFVQGQKEAQQVSEVQQAHPDINTYRVGKDLWTKDEFLKQAQDVKNYYGEDVPVPQSAIDLFETTDPEVKQQLNELFKKEVHDADQIPKAVEVPRSEQAGTAPQVAKGEEAQLQEPAGQGKEKEGVTFWHEDKDLPPNLKERLDVGKKPTPEQTAEIDKTKELLRTEPDGTKVYSVDGNLVRSTVHPDFAMGGNDMAYPAFVPKGEVWVEKDLVGDARNTTITHELTERRSMQEGKPYVSEDEKSGAHVDALNAEQNVPEGGGEKTQVVESKEKSGNPTPEGVQKGKPKKPISDLKKKKAEEKKITQKFNDWADKFEKGGTIDDDITMLGVPFLKEKWNGAIKEAADVIRVGGEIAQVTADAVEAALKYIRDTDWYRGLDDEHKQKAENLLTNKVKELAPKEEEPTDVSGKKSELEAKIETELGTDALNKLNEELNKGKSTNAYDIYNEQVKKISDGKIDPKKEREKILKKKSGDDKDEATMLHEMGRLDNENYELSKRLTNLPEGEEREQAIKDKAKVELDIETTALAIRYCTRNFANIGNMTQAYLGKKGELYWTENAMKKRFAEIGKNIELSDDEKQFVKDAYKKVREAEENLKNIRQEYDEVAKKAKDLEDRNRVLEELTDRAQKQRKSDRRVKTQDRVARSQQRYTAARSRFLDLARGKGGFPSTVIPIDPRVAAELGKMATEKVYQGAVKLEEVVQNIWDDIKGDLPDWTKQDIIDHLAKRGIEPKTMSDEARISATVKRTAKIKSKTAHEEFETVKRKKSEISKRLEQAMVDNQSAKWEFEDARMKKMRQNRPFMEKMIDKTISLRTGFALLSGVKIWGKLVAYTLNEMLIKEPLNIITTNLARVLVPKTARGSLSEGQFSWKSEKEFYKTFLQKRTYREAAELLKNRNSYIDKLFGDYNSNIPDEFTLNFGRAHGVEKYPLKKAEVMKQYELIQNRMLRDNPGVDIESDQWKKAVGAAALEKGNSRILMNRNPVSTWMRQQQRKMYNSGTNTGKAGYYVSKLLFPIVNVPTNIAIKTLHSAVGMAEFGAKALSGFKDLRPEEQDKALMYFKEGLPGLALGVIALSNKDTKIDKNHNFYFCGVKVPKILEHIPWILSTRLYAEAKMAYGKKNPHDTFVEKTVKGLAAAYIDFEQSIPFLNSELIGGKDIKAIETYLETMVTSFIPQGLADITKFTDPRTGKVDWEKFFKGATKTYKPRNIKERFETRIPGMSKKVPVKKIR